MQNIFRIENVVDGDGLFNSSHIFEWRDYADLSNEVCMKSEYVNLKSHIYGQQDTRSHPNFHAEKSNLDYCKLTESVKSLFDGVGSYSGNGSTYFGCNTLHLLISHWLHRNMMLLEKILALNSFVIAQYEVPDEFCYHFKLQSIFKKSKATLVKKQSLESAWADWVGYGY